MQKQIDEVMVLVNSYGLMCADYDNDDFDLSLARMDIASKLRELLPVWQPIETAPKDGKDILVLSASNEQFVCYWDGVMFRFATNKDFSCICVKDPTHWMPLPKAPE